MSGWREVMKWVMCHFDFLVFFCLTGSLVLPPPSSHLFFPKLHTVSKGSILQKCWLAPANTLLSESFPWAQCTDPPGLLSNIASGLLFHMTWAQSPLSLSHSHFASRTPTPTPNRPHHLPYHNPAWGKYARHKRKFLWNIFFFYPQVTWSLLCQRLRVYVILFVLPIHLYNYGAFWRAGLSQLPLSLAPNVPLHWWSLWRASWIQSHCPRCYLSPIFFLNAFSYPQDDNIRSGKCEAKKSV